MHAKRKEKNNIRPLPLVRSWDMKNEERENDVPIKTDIATPTVIHDI